MHQVALTNARVLTLPLDGDVRLCSSKAKLFTNIHLNCETSIISNASIFEDLFPGIDAMMSQPFVFFRFCDKSTCSSNTENELLNSLCLLLEKFQAIPRTDVASRSSVCPRINFFFTVPDKDLGETFTLVNEPRHCTLLGGSSMLLSAADKPGFDADCRLIGNSSRQGI